MLIPFPSLRGAQRRSNIHKPSIGGTGLLRYARNDTTGKRDCMPDPDDAARNALRLIGPDPQNWVPERPASDGRPIDHNVAIVGGGQSGCAFAFALRRAGVGRVTVIDRADGEARMNVLRTPKSLPGPELGIPALGFQSWYEARHGSAAYAAFER